MNWWRAHHGIANDSKLAVVAKRSSSRRCDVLALWVCCLDFASQNEIRGSIAGIDPEELAISTDIPVETIEAVFQAFREKEMILPDGMVGAWEKRQPVREREDDDSAERVRRYREKVRAGGCTVGGYARHQKEVFERDGAACVYCGETERKKLCLDHGIPVCQGGDDDPMNLYTACKRCNSGKSGRTPEEAGYPFVNKAAEELFRQNVERMSRLRASVTPRHAKSPIDKNRGEKRREEEKNFFPPLPQPLQTKKVLPMPDFAIEDWFEERMRRHPNKRDKMLAKSILCQKGNASDPGWREEFTRVHEAWIRSPMWNGKHVHFVPVMAKFIDDEWYLSEPPEEKTETQRAMEAL